MRSCRGASWTRLGQATLCLETNVSFVCRSGRSSRSWRCRFSWHRPLDALARRWHTATMALPLLGLVCPATALVLRLLSEDGPTSFKGVQHCFIALMPALGAAIWLGTLAWGPAPIELPTASRLLSGDLALPFWIGFVLLGILIPAAVLVLSSFSPMFRFGNFIGLISAAAAAAAIARTTELLGGASSWRFFLT